MPTLTQLADLSNVAAIFAARQLLARRTGPHGWPGYHADYDRAQRGHPRARSPNPELRHSAEDVTMDGKSVWASRSLFFILLSLALGSLAKGEEPVRGELRVARLVRDLGSGSF